MEEKFELKTGYAQAIYTPPMGMNIPGYFNTRISEGIINDLYIRTVAFDNGESKAIYFACDGQGVSTEGGKEVRRLVSEACGIPEENIIIHATHAHTSCYITGVQKANDITLAHSSRMLRHFVDCAKKAFADLAPTTMKIATGEAKGVGFIRRYEMKDGSVVTNPRFGNPDIVRPVGTQDNSVQLIRLVRENAKEIVIVNFGTHPDTLGGKLYFRDWPGYVVDNIEKLFDNEVHAVLINGCQGNSNHWDKMRPTDFGMQGVGKAQRMARIITGEVMKIYDSVEEIPAGKIRGFVETTKVGQNPCDPADIEPAKKMRELYKEFGDAAHPALVEYRANTGMSVPKSNRILANLEGPEFFEIPVFGFQVGSLAFIAYPGEPFCEIGLAVKEKSKMAMTVVSCCSNAAFGYFPTAEAFATVGGYENNSSRFAHNVADLLAESGIKIVSRMEK